MLEYLSINEAKYLADLVAGRCHRDFYSDEAQARLVAKLQRLADWALREDAARERIRAL